MAKSTPGRVPNDDRIERLTQAYRTILEGYAAIVSLSVEECDRLLNGGPIGEVNEILRRKKALLAEIRDEEERVKSAREWWKKVRRSLPAEAGRELLSLLDSISRTVERSLALEAECRRLLEQRIGWGKSKQPETSTLGKQAGAAAAYGRVTTPGGGA